MRFINKPIVKKAILAFIALIICAGGELLAQSIYINGAVVTSDGATVVMGGDLQIQNTSSFTQNGGSISLYGSWTNNGVFSSSAGVLQFLGTASASISGTGIDTFNVFILNKTGSAGSNILLLNKTSNVLGLFDAQNGIFRFDNTNALALSINGGLQIAASSTFEASSIGSQIHSLSLNGALTNNGSLTLLNSNGKVNLTFFGAGKTIFSGTGTSAFNEIQVNKSSLGDSVSMNSAFTVPNNFLTMSKGSLLFDGSYSLNNNLFKVAANSYSIPQGSALIVDNANVSITGQDASMSLGGAFYLNKGSARVGNGTVERSIIYSNGATLNLGSDASVALTVGAGIYRLNDADSINYSQNGGVLNIGSDATVSTANRGAFDIGASKSLYNVSGGTITLLNPSLNYDDFYVQADSGTVSGGTLVVNPTSASQNSFSLKSKKAVGVLTLNGINNPAVSVVDSLRVLGDVNLAGTGLDRFKLNASIFYFGGNFNNNLTDSLGFNAGSSASIINGSVSQYLQGSQISTFYNLSLDKSAGTVFLSKPTTINNNLRIVSNTILDMTSNDLTIGASGAIYSDYASTEDILSFNMNKGILNSGSATNPLLGAKLIRYLNTSHSFPYVVYYPIGTSAQYSPSYIQLETGGVTFGSNPSIAIKVVPLEHPASEIPNHSLKKYWNIASNNLTMNNRGATIYGYYNSSEIAGNEGSYKVLNYAPAWNDVNGYWRIDPGQSNNVVNINYNFFYSQLVNTIEGDWTVGEPDMAKATYYARADGDYDDPNTWSKVYYDGSVSATIPNKRSDVVHVQNHVVRVKANTALASSLNIETGTEGRSSGKLKVLDGFYCSGDTFNLQSGATLIIGDVNGLSSAPTLSGPIRSTVRLFSSGAIYTYDGATAQVVGSGLPDPISSLVVTKPNGVTLTLNKQTSINDSLVINSGVFDLGSSYINGNSSGRTMTMRGGEMIVRSVFPANYTPPTFTAGKITFDGTSNSSVPSSTSIPGVAQYYDLKIAGSNRAGNITLKSSGEIIIGNDLDLSALAFANNSYRFFTNGSTVRFNKSSGSQNISCKPLSPVDSVCYLEYYNLILDGAGTKILIASGTPYFKITNNLTITNNATFNTNNLNIEVQGNWTNLSGNFIPGTGALLFNSPVAGNTTTLTSRDTAANPFNNVYVKGAGIFQPLDNMQIRGNLTIDTLSTLAMTTNSLYLQGNWTNLGGTFSPGTSSVYFNGTLAQTLSRTSNNATFNNLIVNNANGLNAYAIGVPTNGVIINNNLTLQNGVLRVHNGTTYRYAQVAGLVTRPGGGYVDGELRKNIIVGSDTTAYEIGYKNSYTPVTLTFSGTGGKAGYLGVLSDTVTTSSSPISWSAGAILPAGSTMAANQLVSRQWLVNIPSTSTFTIGVNRLYKAYIQYIGGDTPNGDIRNGSLASQFEARVYNGTNWINPFYYSTRPNLGVKTANSIEYTNLSDFGSMIVGMPGLLTFFTRQNGNWSDPNTWSLQSYGGLSATIYPSQTANYQNVKVYVGNADTVTLDVSPVINTVSVNTGLLQIDSSGALMCGSNYMSGTGDFILGKDGTLGIGDPYCITAVGTTATAGNIRNSGVRNFNYLSNNRGHFIYTGSFAQTQTNAGLPSAFSSLIINKTASADVTINTQNLVISDSIYIKSGSFTAGHDITLNGNFRRNNNTIFNNGSRRITFSGIVGDTITNGSSSPIVFSRFYINKLDGSGNVVLNANSPIQITDSLNFSITTNYKSLLDAKTYAGNYVIIGNNTVGAVVNTSYTAGWIYGEERKYIAAGDAATMLYELGDSKRYSPFSIDFAAGANSVAGYLAMNIFEGSHPYHIDSTIAPISVSRVIGPKYWRLTKPANSTFVRGARNYTLRFYMTVPGDAALVDFWGCAEIAYIRKWTGGVDWQPLYDNANNSSDGSAACSDTKTSTLTPNFNYTGAVTGTLAYTDVANITTSQAFGSTEIIGSDTLFADFIAGNRNSIKYFTFYSIKNGDWTDPSTWSTVSFNDTLNQAIGYSDPIVRPFPRRQYDVGIIGNGKRVVLNTNIGHNVISGTTEINSLAGPGVVVYSNGTLSLNYHTLRGVGFSVEKNGTIEVGAQTGINNISAKSGNVILSHYVSDPKVPDSCNIIYTSEGYTPNLESYSIPNRVSSAYYIQKFAIYDNNNNLIMENITNDTLIRASNGVNNYYYKKAVLTAGSTYYIKITPSTNSAANRYYRLFLDYNYNGNCTDAGETATSFNSTSDAEITSGTFTVPAGTNQGSTLLRVGISTAAFVWSDAGTGEFEDYTADILNASTLITQAGGNLLPTKLYSLQLNSPKASNIFQLNKALVAIDSLKINSGLFQARGFTISNYGDFINNVAGGFDATTGGNASVEFLGNSRDTIRGSQAIAFYRLNCKKSGDSLIINNDISVSNLMSLDSNYCVSLKDGKTITIGSAATLTAGTGAFNSKRMINVTGSTNTGAITKYFATGASARTITFPVGVDTVYNEAKFAFTATLTGTPYMSLRLFKGSHPQKLFVKALNKYWSVTTSGFTYPTTIDNTTFKYIADDINGNILKYIPGQFINGGWEINLGQTPRSNDTMITVPTYTSMAGWNGAFAGDWTAGEPKAFTDGKVFYSRNAASTGYWNDPLTWSNDRTNKHAGNYGAYFPGQLFDKDTVVIDGNTVTFRDSANITVDSIAVGGSNSNGTAGILIFGDTPLQKSLSTRVLYLAADNEQVYGLSPGTRQDTLKINGSLYNYSTGAGAGFTLRTNANNSTTLMFNGTGISNIYGTGIYGLIGNIICAKTNGLSDTLIVSSSAFDLATRTATNYLYTPYSGVLRHSIADTMVLSSSAASVNMMPYSGFDVRAGAIKTKATLYTNSGATISVNGGDMFVGNAANQHLFYKTGSSVSVINGKLDIAGGFARYITTSSVNVLVQTGGTIRANTVGNTDANVIGFDLGAASSSFTMTGGRIVLANIMGSSLSPSDFKLDAANGGGMTGGVIQSGDSALTPAGTVFKIAGTAPVYDLHFANSASKAVSTQISEETFIIKHNWVIDANHSFNLNGNSVYLAGSLYNYGTFTATPGVTTSSPWLISLNGSGVQTIFNSASPALTLFNLKIDKSAGLVLLDSIGSSYSNLRVRNTLEFTTTNNSFISAPIAKGRYVELSPETGANPQIVRGGLGHVSGRLYRWIATGAQSVMFTVGADTAASYRPALIETSGSNTAGLLGVVAYGIDHPQIVTSTLDTSKNVKKYWNLSSNGFALGASNKFSLTTYYQKISDARATSSPLFYEHRLYYPACPDPPALCPGSGAWSIIDPLAKTDSSVTSANLALFGDYALGEPAGITFYSYQNGLWSDVNSWSLSGYTTANTPSRIPNLNTDIVRIGNGKVITVATSTNANLRSLIIEKYNNLIGTLYIQGYTEYINGQSFVLEDSCTLGIEHINGIDYNGAIHMNNRTFGVSTYIFNAAGGVQKSGSELPAQVKSLVIDLNNTHINNNVFYMTKTSNTIVRDTLLVKQGQLFLDRTLTLYKALVLDSVINDGGLIDTSGLFKFDGPADKYLTMNNYAGASFFNFEISGGNLFVNHGPTRQRKSQIMSVKNQLNFSSAGTHITLGDSVYVKLKNSATSSLMNTASDRAFVTSATSGMFIRKVVNSNTYTFPLVSKETGSYLYAPATFVGDASGDSGYIGVRTSQGVNATLAGAHKRLAPSALAVYIKRYWAIDSVSAKINGQWTFDYSTTPIVGVQSKFDRVMRWNPSMEGANGAWTQYTTNITIDTTSRFFKTSPSFAYANFAGDWTIGNNDAFRRIFFSRSSGLWTDSNTWTFSPTHSGAIFGKGLYPNLALDSVVIGGGLSGAGNHEVTMTEIDTVSGLALGTSASNSGTLNCGAFSLYSSYFSLGDYSKLKIGSPLGIATLGDATGNIISSITRNYNSLARYEYNGSVNQIIGSGLPASIISLKINNSGALGSNTVTAGKSISVTDSLTIASGRLDVGSLYNINTSSSTSIFSILPGTTLRLGGTSNLLSAVSGYGVYNIDTASVIEFYGNTGENQTISQLPTKITNGLGNVLLNNAGQKIVAAPLLIRGNLTNANNANFVNQVGVNSLTVEKNIINSANINNNGVIEIGK